MTDKVSFCALGGLGEIGLNSYVYSYINDKEEEHLLVDLGMGFKDTRVTSLDTFFPDMTYFTAYNRKPKALIITHGHEDHIGAIPYLIEQLDCPIYATEWTADLIHEKLAETNLQNKVKIIVVEHHKEYDIGNFKVKWVPVYHSIVDCSLLVITTKLGKIAHTGDFKVKISDTYSLNILKELKTEKIKYLICDSTNVLEKGSSGEDAHIKEDLTKIIADAKGACWIGLFSSNLERIRVIAEIAQDLKKRIVLFGRSLNLYVSLGIKHNYLDSNFFIDESEIANIPRDKLIFLATGSQGEDRSVLSNVIVKDAYKEKLQDQDIVIFSSAVIPGNEAKVLKYYNTLAERNIKYYTSREYKIHVSGHGKQDELKIMYECINPQWIIPMHGEAIHLKYHTQFVKNLGYKSSNFHCGEVVELFSDYPEIIGRIEVGKLAQEGHRLISINEDFIKVRTKIFYEGVIFASVRMRGQTVQDVRLEVVGLITELERDVFNQELSERIVHNINTILEHEALEDDKLEEELRILIRKYFKNKLSKKPVVIVHLVK